MFPTSCRPVFRRVEKNTAKIIPSQSFAILNQTKRNQQYVDAQEMNFCTCTCARLSMATL